MFVELKDNHHVVVERVYLQKNSRLPLCKWWLKNNAKRLREILQQIIKNPAIFHNIIVSLSIIARILKKHHFRIKQIYSLIQWSKKLFSQPPIVQVLPLKKMREACNFHHSYTSTMTDKMRGKNLENHIVGFLMNLFANYGGK